MEEIKVKSEQLWSTVPFLRSVLLPPTELVCKAQTGKIYKLKVIVSFKILEMGKNYSD